MPMPNPNAPVYLVLTEVRFSPVLGLEGYVPAIQEKLRRSGFPDFQRRVSQQLILSTPLNAENTSPPGTASHTSYVFADMKREQIITLNSNALSFQTAVYEHFPAFLQTFLDVLEVVHQAIDISFFDRLGLRYLDVVLPNASGGFDDTLVPEVVGVSHLMDGQLEHSYSETLLKEGFEHLLARVYIQNGVLAIPADLFGLTPQFPERFTNVQGLHVILENDAAYTNRELFSLEKISHTLKRIQTKTSASFKKMVTPAALQKWGIS
jgi:uncharacterized protein (TIGR04255 family)